jgi:hypothetical protein
VLRDPLGDLIEQLVAMRGDKHAPRPALLRPRDDDARADVGLARPGGQHDRATRLPALDVAVPRLDGLRLIGP